MHSTITPSRRATRYHEHELLITGFSRKTSPCVPVDILKIIEKFTSRIDLRDFIMFDTKFNEKLSFSTHPSCIFPNIKLPMPSSDIEFRDKKKTVLRLVGENTGTSMKLLVDDETLTQEFKERLVNRFDCRIVDDCVEFATVNNDVIDYFWEQYPNSRITHYFSFDLTNGYGKAWDLRRLMKKKKKVKEFIFSNGFTAIVQVFLRKKLIGRVRAHFTLDFCWERKIAVTISRDRVVVSALVGATEIDDPLERILNVFADGGWYRHVRPGNAVNTVSVAEAMVRWKENGRLKVQLPASHLEECKLSSTMFNEFVRILKEFCRDDFYLTLWWATAFVNRDRQ